MFFEAPEVPCIPSAEEDYPKGMFAGSDVTQARLANIPEVCAERWSQKLSLTAFVLFWPSVSSPICSDGTWLTPAFL